MNKKKLNQLEKRITELGRVAVAYSSGVDSTFLLKTAHDLLGDNAIAITAKSFCFMKAETKEAEEFCKKEGIKQIIVEFNPLEVEEFKNNVPQRCYFCKKALFGKIKEIAENCGISHVLDGTNADDLSDYRPGMKALEELGIISPLLDAGLTKNDIRLLSEEKGLATFNKPSFACLATRIPYGEAITKDALLQIEKAEERLCELGFKQYRVRKHGNIARIEVLKEELSKAVELESEIAPYFKSLGFAYVTLDLEGFISGSMNRNLRK